MTREQVQELLITIVTYYPNMKVADSSDGLTKMIDLWHKQLKNVEFEEAEEMLNRYIQSDNGIYPPNVSYLIPKTSAVHGFKGRTYSPEFFEELEREIVNRYK